MAETKYLTLQDVLLLHKDVMALTGCPPTPLKGGGDLLLESALAAAPNAAHYEGADLVRQAALLAVRISQRQPFVEGNKRTGFYAASTFLRLNGLAFRGDPLTFARQLEIIAEAREAGMDLDALTVSFEAWLRGEVRPDDGSGGKPSWRNRAAGWLWGAAAAAGAAAGSMWWARRISGPGGTGRRGGSAPD